MRYHVKVKFSAGTHITSTVAGKRASSTMSAKHAVNVLALKVFPGVATVRRIGGDLSAGGEVWEIEGERQALREAA